MSHISQMGAHIKAQTDIMTQERVAAYTSAESSINAEGNTVSGNNSDRFDASVAAIDAAKLAMRNLKDTMSAAVAAKKADIISNADAAAQDSFSEAVEDLTTKKADIDASIAQNTAQSATALSDHDSAYGDFAAFEAAYDAAVSGGDAE